MVVFHVYNDNFCWFGAGSALTSGGAYSPISSPYSSGEENQRGGEVFVRLGLPLGPQRGHPP
jgi:hypothetical protein